MILLCEGFTKRQRIVRRLASRTETTLYTAGDKSRCRSRTTRSGQASARCTACSTRCKALQYKRSNRSCRHCSVALGSGPSS
ncbi:hypothetical protein JG687_00002062 [Phytophthora cactorum]|uniref:Uncharacterized protein n=1 Tax=Phytophthora cactorum TaxID=29920 RepID=A0A8T1UW10_9STRA|nr:hypothetical protein JG687_00002062 [Phytophthora cactorum]